MVAAWLATSVAALAACTARPERTLTLATTTSVANSGLLDLVAPAFRDHTGIQVRAHLAGSGRALQMLARGAADVAISHAPEAETAALSAHPGWLYRKVMFNDFVIVGPAGDPAQVRSAHDAVDAFRRIARADDVLFASRGDRSGTHEREQRLWTEAAVRPPGERLLITGSGMAVTLRAASAQRAYTLTDRPTFLQLANRLQLQIVHEGDARLLNTYAVIVPGGGRLDEAGRFADWLSNGRGRAVIAGYEVGGTRAFHVWPAGCPGTTPAAKPCTGR